MEIVVLIFLGLFLLKYRHFVFSVIKNPMHAVFYALKDVFLHFYHRNYDLCPYGKVYCYVANFGGGKTMSAVHYVSGKYRKFHNRTVWCMERKKFVTQKIHILSNVDIAVPFEKLISLEQVVRCAERFRDYDEKNDTLTITLVLGDEFSSQMNSRDFKNNMNSMFLNTLLTSRHYHISIIYTTQEFSFVDSMLRKVTFAVVECRKMWRVMMQYQYDPKELEQSTSTSLIKPTVVFSWFIFDKDYNSFNTFACVQNLIKSWNSKDMLSDDEIKALQSNPDVTTTSTITRPSRKYIKATKKLRS